MVLIDHAGPDFSLHRFTLPGSIAVQSFYIISGFYMALVLHRKYNFPGATRLFYQQRYLRLAPIYWVTLLITIALSAFYMQFSRVHVGKLGVWVQYAGQMSPGALTSLSLSQLSLFGLDGMMFGTLSGSPLHLHFTANWGAEPLPAVRFLLVGPAWSLSVELLFYLVAPFIVRRSVPFQLIIVAATFALRITAASFGFSQDPWDNRFFPFEAGVFILGSLAYRCLTPAERFMRPRKSLRWVLAAVLGASILFYNGIPGQGGLRHWLLLSLVLYAVPLLFAVTKDSPLDRWIGELSYPLYLLHEVVFFAVEPLLRRLSGLAFDAAVILVPFGAAVIVYQLVERRLESWRAKHFERQHKLAAAPVPAAG